MCLVGAGQKQLLQTKQLRMPASGTEGGDGMEQLPRSWGLLPPTLPLPGVSLQGALWFQCVQ